MYYSHFTDEEAQGSERLSNKGNKVLLCTSLDFSMLNSFLVMDSFQMDEISAEKNLHIISQVGGLLAKGGLMRNRVKEAVASSV